MPDSYIHRSFILVSGERKTIKNQIIVLDHKRYENKHGNMESDWGSNFNGMIKEGLFDVVTLAATWDKKPCEHLE